MKVPMLIIVFTVLASFFGFTQAADTLPYRLFNDPTSSKGYHLLIGQVELVTLKPACVIEELQPGGNNKTAGIRTYCHPQSIFETMDCETACEMDSSQIDCVERLSEEDETLLLRSLVIYPDRNRIYTMCYEPRNGILLRSHEGKLIGFLEICFDCGNQCFFDGNSIVHVYDLGGKKQLKELFVKYGLHYGVLYK